MVSGTCSEKSARKYHAQNAETNQKQNGYNQIKHRAVFSEFFQTYTARCHFHFRIGNFAHLVGVGSVGVGNDVEFSHRREIVFRQHNGDNENDGEKGVEIEWNCLTKQC